ncbi:hypothetical protein ACVWWI_003343 [Bradyrhizobium sp. USDA 3686]|nr:hypothetical protein [Bradyrhizobium canariense]
MKQWRAKSPEPAEDVKRFYWQNYGLAVIRIDDESVPWDTRELVRQYMARQHGPCRIGEAKA